MTYLNSRGGLVAVFRFPEYIRITMSSPVPRDHHHENCTGRFHAARHLVRVCVRRADAACPDGSAAPRLSGPPGSVTPTAGTATPAATNGQGRPNAGRA